MNCPNCKNPFAFESGGKFHCDTCGWFEDVGDPNPEWHTCEAPEPKHAPEPSPAALDPVPAALDPDRAIQEPTPEPDPEPQVKKYLGGIVTVTEIDE